MILDPEELQDLDKVQRRAARKLKHVVEEAASAVPVLLNEKQELFCQLLVKYAGDAKRSYSEAGYSTAGKSWEREASRLKGHPKIKRRMDQLRGNLAMESGITEGWVLAQAKRFVDRAYTLGDIKAGREILELCSKILGIVRDKDKAAMPALVQNLNFITGREGGNDLQRLARAAGVQVIDVDSKSVGGERLDGAPAGKLIEMGGVGSGDNNSVAPSQDLERS